MKRLDKLVETSEKEIERLTQLLGDAQYGSDMLDLQVCIDLERAKLAILQRLAKLAKFIK